MELEEEARILSERIIRLDSDPDRAVLKIVNKSINELLYRADAVGKPRLKKMKGQENL